MLPDVVRRPLFCVSLPNVLHRHNTHTHTHTHTPTQTEGVEARNAKIAALTEGASLVRAAARVHWVEAGAQPDLERQFDVLAYPSLVLLDGEAATGRVHSLDAAADSVVAAALSEDPRTTRFADLVALDVQAWAGQAFAYPSA